ncbi:PucR family transcriptional regulator [Nocardioides rubriscoriae]|uniref:PucR family transcriptional regulator n=1 Tax=Nocardioides rubriscoriae TaxID=642762 RepID=UPI0011DF798C|nr:helix-turn-helix domain-containing protein [Nocardioides rubriscoriae]
MTVACEQILDRVDEIARATAQTIRQEEPLYVEVMSYEELVHALRPNIIGLVESVMVNEASLLAAPRRTGRERAQARVPLTMVLHAYRLTALHIWDHLVRLCGDDIGSSRALLDSASALWSTVDVYCQELAAAYRDVELEQLMRDVRIREAALASLFNGTSSNGRGVAEVADALRLPKVGRFVVVASDSWPAEGERAPATAERALASLGVRSAWRSEADGEVGLVVLNRAQRADRLMDYLTSLTVGRVGISETFEAVVDTPQAVTQARLARDTATPGENAVMRYGEARVAALVAGAPDLAIGLAHQVLGPVLEQKADERDLLICTLRAWFDAQGSAAEAARLLHCHPNTVRYRLTKVTQLTGRDLHAPGDVVHLYLALEATRLWLPTGGD